MNKQKKIVTPFIGKTKLLKVGNSVYVRVPQQFLECNDVDAGDEVGIYANSDLLISTDERKVEKAHRKIEELIREK